MTATEPKQHPSALRTLTRFSMASVLLLSVEGFIVGKAALEKTLTALVMPCGLIWYLLSFAVFLAIASRQKTLAFFTLLTWCLYTTVGNGFVSTWMAANIEAAFTKISPLDEEPFDYVILLGGGASTGINQRHQGNSAGDRLLLTAQLYHAGKVRKLIVTGTRIKELTNVDADPSQQSGEMLISLGVPADAIEMLGGQTTSQEMKSLGERFTGQNLRIGMVTSAWHLRRAMRLANRNNFQPHPLPADFISGPDVPWTLATKVNACIPQADSFVLNTKIAREYLGSFVGR